MYCSILYHSLFYNAQAAIVITRFCKDNFIRDEAKILGKSQSSISKIVGQKSILHHYNIQNVKDGIGIRVYTVNKQFATHFSQFNSVKVKKM